MNDRAISKAEAIRRHAGRRGAERYGGVPEETERRIVRAVRDAERARKRDIRDRVPIEFRKPEPAVFQWTSGHGRGVWRVRIDERDYWVVWEPPTRRIVTYLPPETCEARHVERHVQHRRDARVAG